ncbi:membrane associated rhomboid family serine protease [Alteromonadaceae bacterium 2753L.S.0a.02]|nr:membrane associated rhomboid family serine protease [Alteromonadaceae bacterium 2753L.S.0a.02]
MIIFLIVTSLYLSGLFLIRPAPLSLREPMPGLIESFYRIPFTVIVGLSLLIVHLLATNFTFQELSSGNLKYLALNNSSEYWMWWPVQLLTHSFVHSNFIHLVTNVHGLGLLSLYERRVGSMRALQVFLVGAVAAMPSVVVYPEGSNIVGASGAVFALAAAYFTDEKQLSTRDWIIAIIYFLVVWAVMTVYSGLRSSGSLALASIQVDHVGHFLGALGGILFCRFFPLGWRKTVDLASSADSPAELAPTVLAPTVLGPERQATIAQEAPTISVNQSEISSRKAREPAPLFQSLDDGLVKILNVQDEQGNANEFIAIDDALSAAFIAAVQNFDENKNDHALKEEVLNLLFRVQDRLARFPNKKYELHTLIDALEKSSVSEYVSYFRKFV